MKFRVGRELCVCGLLNDSSLRVRGEGTEQNLRHVLLAKGHQEQRQALIGWIHAATLKTDKEEGRRGSNKNNTEKYVMEVEMFMKNSATLWLDWLSQVQPWELSAIIDRVRTQESWLWVRWFSAVDTDLCDKLLNGNLDQLMKHFEAHSFIVFSHNVSYLPTTGFSFFFASLTLQSTFLRNGQTREDRGSSLCPSDHMPSCLLNYSYELFTRLYEEA